MIVLVWHDVTINQKKQFHASGSRAVFENVSWLYIKGHDEACQVNELEHHHIATLAAMVSSKPGKATDHVALR